MGFAETENCVGPVLAIGRVGALCGNVHMIEGSAWITDNALVLSTYSDSVPIKYLAIILKARNLNDTANKTAQPLITGTGVLNERIPIPPKSEQDAIVNHLDMSTTDIEATIARARRQIELLQEYRTRLIADVVTGKLDVRDAAAQLPYEDDDGQDPMIEESDLPPGVMSADPQDPAAPVICRGIVVLVPTEPKIYHIVHVDRLASIISDGYLWSDAEARKRGSRWDRDRIGPDQETPA